MRVNNKTQKARRGSNKLVRFRGILRDFVWFAVSSIMLFYSRKVEAEVHQFKLHLSWSLSKVFNTGDPSIEKTL